MGAFLDGPAHSKCLEIAKKRRRPQRAFLAKIKNLKVQEQRPFPETCSKQCLIFSSAKYNHIYIEMYCIFLFFLLYWSVYPLQRCGRKCTNIKFNVNWCWTSRLGANLTRRKGKYTSALPRCTCLPSRQICIGVALGDPPQTPLQC